MKTREELVKAVEDARAAYAAVYFGDATTAKWGYDHACQTEGDYLVVAIRALRAYDRENT
jgi:hypothetical protein